MISRRTNYSMTACVATVLLLMLEGCASSAEKDEIPEDPTAQATTIRCPAGYTMICEAKKVGRIRFGTMGKENLDSCACEPENTGRPASPVIPSIN
jgi:hypothetical protein